MWSDTVWTVGVFASALATLAAGPDQAYTFQVDLTTQESLGIARTAEPVSGGVPLPPGVFKSNQLFTLLDDDGNEYVRELCRLCAETLSQSPLLDERGFHCSSIPAMLIWYHGRSTG